MQILLPYIGVRVEYLQLTLANSEGQSQGYANCDCKYVLDGERVQILPVHGKQPIGFRLVYLHLTLVHSKGHSQGNANCGS